KRVPNLGLWPPASAGGSALSTCSRARLLSSPFRRSRARERVESELRRRIGPDQHLPDTPECFPVLRSMQVQGWVPRRHTPAVLVLLGLPTQAGPDRVLHNVARRVLKHLRLPFRLAQDVIMRLLLPTQRVGCKDRIGVLAQEGDSSQLVAVMTESQQEQ